MADIVFICVIGFVLVALCYVIINLMMLNNSVNKRLVNIIEGLLVDQGRPLPPYPELDEEDEYDNHGYDPYQVEVK